MEWPFITKRTHRRAITEMGREIDRQLKRRVALERELEQLARECRERHGPLLDQLLRDKARVRQVWSGTSKFVFEYMFDYETALALRASPNGEEAISTMLEWMKERWADELTVLLRTSPALRDLAPPVRETTLTWNG